MEHLFTHSSDVSDKPKFPGKDTGIITDEKMEMKGVIL